MHNKQIIVDMNSTNEEKLNAVNPKLKSILNSMAENQPMEYAFFALAPSA